MAVLESHVDVNSTEFQGNREYHEALARRLGERLAHVKAVFRSQFS